jgi:hypothetical protein
MDCRAVVVDAMTLRTLHLAAALFCLPFLAMYAASGVQMAHRRWFPLHDRVSVERVMLSAGIGDARAVARLLPARGELAGIRVSPVSLRFRIARPGTVWEVDYSIATGETSVRTVRAGFVGMLNRIHQTQGMWHELALIDVWAGSLGVVSLGLLLLGASGLYLWFRNRAERVIGVVLLIAGSGLAAALIVSMRIP